MRKRYKRSLPSRASALRVGGERSLANGPDKGLRLFFFRAPLKESRDTGSDHPKGDLNVAGFRSCLALAHA